MIVFKKYDEIYIKSLRKDIRTMFLEEFVIEDIKHIDVRHVEVLFKYYDHRFFENQISYALKDTIKFSTSNKMTKSGGKTIYSIRNNRKFYEIKVSNVLLMNFNRTDDVKRVCGIDAYDFIDALMLILEHELCHVIEFYNYSSSSCKKDRFKFIANNIFGHKSSYHELLKQKNYDKEPIYINYGQVVYFYHKGSLKTGIVTNINKRATVMVKDRNGIYRDKNGVLHSKWYVPLSMLREKE